jgi:hypothetical protein
MKFATILLIATLTLSDFALTVSRAKGDDFGSVVKMIEQFYKVKHQGVPFLAKAGMKAARTAARIKGGTARQIAESGSVKLAVFDDQQFDMNSDFTHFRATLNAAMSETWMPFVQTLSATDKEQTYIFLRSAGEKFDVLVITIETRDATVVQVTVSATNLALLMKDPDGIGKSITDEATISDQE